MNNRDAFEAHREALRDASVLPVGPLSHDAAMRTCLVGFLYAESHPHLAVETDEPARAVDEPAPPVDEPALLTRSASRRVSAPGRRGRTRAMSRSG